MQAFTLSIPCKEGKGTSVKNIKFPPLTTKLGATNRVGASKPAIIKNANSISQLPAQFSWRNAEDVGLCYKSLGKPSSFCVDILQTPQSQQGCGSCWSIVATQLLADRLTIKTGQRCKTLAVTWPLACVKSADTNACSSGNPEDALEYAMYYGLPYEENCCDYSFCTSSKGCAGACVDSQSCDLKQINTTIPSCADLKKRPGCQSPRVFVEPGSILQFKTGGSNTNASIKEEIYKNGPVIALFIIFADFLAGSATNPVWQNTAGIYIHGSDREMRVENQEEPAYKIVSGSHGVTIVGWGEQIIPGYGMVPFWVVRNSWGTTWNDGGYFKCAISDESRAINLNIGMDRPVDQLGGVIIANPTLEKMSKTHKQRVGSSNRQQIAQSKFTYIEHKQKKCKTYSGTCALACLILISLLLLSLIFV